MRSQVKRFVGLFLVGILPFYAFAQHRVEGRVNDVEQKALPYASVRLLRADSTYVSDMTADSLGHYSFVDVASDEYLLSFNLLGYKPKCVSVSVRNTDVNVPVVSLESDDVLLSEVTVSGSSIIYKRDRTLIIPDMQQRKHAYSGYDLLYNLMIPGIDVDTRKGTVSNERGAVTVYINGVRADYGIERAGCRDGLYQWREGGYAGGAELASERYREGRILRYAFGRLYG